MFESQTNRLQDHLASIIRMAIGLGVFVRVGTDLEEFRSICHKTPSKSAVGPAFDTSEVDILPSDAMWITGHLANGEIVHTQAMKVINLGQSTLQQHFREHLSDFRIGGFQIDVPNTPWRLTPEASEISGLITYHGELWLKGGPDGIRGGCLATILSRLMLIMGLLRWSPDYLIGIQAALTSCRGLAAREGYMRTEQRVVEWNRGPSLDPIEGWLVWMTKKEAEFNLDVPPESFYKMLEIQPTSSTRNVA